MPDPRLFGRYRVDRRIGSGAFATVWLAHDDLLESPVAVKVLAENWTDRLDIRTRFAEEARILRRADSDHVVRVHDIGELDDGRPYFVMTYADAGTLAERLEGPISPELAMQHALGVADGLAVLHRLGVVHRDVKPSNVLFRTDRHEQRLLIADLGLARAVAHASGFTLAAGTPGYMAPEQAVMGGGVDARADVYAIGALIVHMLSGKTPRMVSDERSAESALADAGDISGPLGEVVRKALSPPRDDRYASAGEMAAALRRAGAQPAQISPGGLESRVDSPRQSAVPQRKERAADRLAAIVEQSRPPSTRISEPVSSPGRSRVFRSRGRRRRRWVGIGALVVLVAGGGGGYAIWRMNSGGSGPVTVSDGQLSVKVPNGWSGQYKSGGWPLDPFGEKGKNGHGIEVSEKVTDWQAVGSTTPGVFVGIGDSLNGKKAATVLADVQHPGCTASTPTGLPGTSKQWNCGNSVVYTDTVLTKKGNLVYVQVKRIGTDTAGTKAILDSVTVK